MATCNYESSNMMCGTGNTPESMHYLSHSRATAISAAPSVSFFAQSFELSIISSHVVAGIILSLLVIILSVILA